MDRAIGPLTGLLMQLDSMAASCLGNERIRRSADFSGRSYVQCVPLRSYQRTLVEIRHCCVLFLLVWAAALRSYTGPEGRKSRSQLGCRQSHEVRSV